MGLTERHGLSLAARCSTLESPKAKDSLGDVHGTGPSLHPVSGAGVGIAALHLSYHAGAARIRGHGTATNHLASLTIVCVHAL